MVAIGETRVAVGDSAARGSGCIGEGVPRYGSFGSHNGSSATRSREPVPYGRPVSSNSAPIDVSETTLIRQPLRLPNGAVLANRIAKAAMSEQLATPDLTPSESLAQLYKRWGASGAGLLITGNVMVDRSAMVEARNEVLDGEDALDRFSEWARAATSSGTHCWLQLNHPGRQAPRKLAPEPVAPSAVPMRVGALFARPRALSERQIEDLVGRFARAAGLAARAGFTGVQIHAAHGYLVNQFLSPLTNVRGDAWGGILEGRMRFLLEIVRATRNVVGDAFPISVKLNSADFQRGGFAEEESLVVAKALEAAGIDLLEVSGGTYEAAAMMGTMNARSPSSDEREAYFLEFARRVRGKVSTPILLTGGFRSLEGMTDALSKGIDMVGLARPLVLEPDLPRRLLGGEATRSVVQPKRSGLKRIDGMLELYWYGLQLRRLGEGRMPDPSMSLWRAFGYAIQENF